jgi:hypothetical protein
VPIACTRVAPEMRHFIARAEEVLRDSGAEPVIASAHAQAWRDLISDAPLGLLIVSPNEAECAQALREIRSSLELALTAVIACLPSVPSSSRASIDPFARCADHADAVVDFACTPSELRIAFAHVRRISSALRTLRPLPIELGFSGRRRALILRYLTSRNLTMLTPERNPLHPRAHSFGPLEEALGPTLVSDLEALAAAELLGREFFERMHVCPECGDARLLFREVCARCRSADLRRGGVIHHYRCGHVAAEEAFRRGSDLSCPSCSHPLRHIGIDYERPASIVFCNTCALRAGEGTTEARCICCGGVHLPAALPERIVWKYVLTEGGRRAAADPAGHDVLTREPSRGER